MSNQDFINSLKDGAINTMKKYGVLASLTLAQAILESSWGKSGLTANYNNLFGIKATGNEPCIEMSTAEYVRGQRIIINDRFRKYNTLAESIEDHGKFLTENSRYKNLLWGKDYKIVCRLIQQDGYATDPNYANLLISIIEENNLAQYDNFSGTYSNSTAIIASLGELQKYLNDKVNAGLVEDGIYGPKTQAAADKCIVSIGAKGNIVIWIQKKLMKLGYAIPSYGIDGNFGSETKNAVIRFQNAKGLYGDGIIGSNTWKALIAA